MIKETAILPLHPTPELNTVIDLWDAVVQIKLGSYQATVTAHFIFRWTPSPRPEMHFQLYDVSPQLERSLIEIEEVNVTMGTTCFTGHLLSITNHWEPTRSESDFIVILEEVDVGSMNGIKSVAFDIANFDAYIGDPIRTNKSTWRGRLILTHGSWKITVDQVNDHRALSNECELSAGSAVTHSGIVESLAGDDININTAKSILEVVAHLLTFAQGRWVPYILPVGYNNQGERVWEHLYMPKGKIWESPLVWFNRQSPSDLQQIFTHLMMHWQDDVWREAFQEALSWYDLAISSSRPHVILVYAQNVLERIAWYQFVTRDSVYEGDKFDKNGAAWRIRKQFGASMIPIQIPPELPTLQQYARDNGGPDGPKIIVDLRNAITHPGNLRAPNRVVLEASILAQWYVDLVFLSFLEYRGTYVNRLEREFVRRLQPVPWCV